MPVDEETRTGESKKDALIREIREDYTYLRDYWRENYEEAKTDLRFVSGDPWEADDRKVREDNGRPVLCPDELEQYLNQAINNLRQNERAIKVNPAGSGADDKDADRRSAIIRGVEYKSNAQGAYTNAFECAINCGFGYFRVTTKKIGKGGEVEPRIRIIENPLSVLPDADAKEADFSDQQKCFVMDTIRERDFGKKYPKAEKKSFSADDMSAAPGWFHGENIVVAEYWKLEGTPGDKDAKVTQYITNGVEILAETKWPGLWIPIIPVTGKKVYKPVGGNMQRFYYSMIRKARGPQMMLAYIASQEAEEYGMAPRVPFIGYVGQFETDKDAWDSLNRVPRAYVQVDPIVDQAGGSVLPMPQRNPFSPNASAYEIGFERWRRSVQSAMGITPLPTAAQRQNEKSGVALDKIQAQQAVGSFHFTANFERSLENAGRQIDQLITEVMDTPRQVSARHPDDSHSLMHVVPSGQQAPPEANPDEVFDPTRGEFDVTISTGMSYQSQREEASAFVDLLVQNINTLPIPPQAKAAMLSKAISLKNIGPIGEELAKILDPQGDGEPIPPQAQQAISQLQQHAQALNSACQHYEQQIQQLQFEKQAKVVETQGKMAVLDKELAVKLAIAEIETKAQNASERMEWVTESVKLLMQQSHERAMQAQGAQHQQDMQAQQADAQSQQSAQDAAQQAQQSQQDQQAQQQQPEAVAQ